MGVLTGRSLRLAGFCGAKSPFCGDFVGEFAVFCLSFYRNFELLFVFERAGCLSYVKAPPQPCALATGVACHVRRAQPPTNPLNGGLFHATAATKPGCVGAGSGERHDETKQTHF